MSAPMKSCVAIINPAGAGGRTRRAWQRAAPVVRRTLEASNYQLVERFTRAPGDAVHLAAEAVASDAAAVLAVGGDGTIHEVVNGMMMHRATLSKQQQQPPNTALAVLPLGTGSDFRRTFSWKENDVLSACQRITNSQRQPLDIVRVVLQKQPCSSSSQADQQQQQQGSSDSDEVVRYFVNISSCGAGAESATYITKFKFLGGLLSYPIAAALALAKYKPSTVEVCLDNSGDWTSLDRLTLLVIGNGCYWGGGMKVMPAASPSDGLLDVLAVQGMGLLDFMAKGHLLRSGKYEGLKGVTVLPRCKTLHIRSARSAAAATTGTPGVPEATSGPTWELDGEWQGQCSSVRMELLQGALQLCV